MNCCGKTMDGLDGDSQGGTLDGDVIITGDLNVQGGQLDLGVGPDGWSNIRSNDAAFGLDLEAPAGKRIRLINDITPIVEIDTNLNLIAPSGSVGLVPATPTTTYDFIFPQDMGGMPGLLLTTQGPGLPTYWSAGAVGPGGTVTSVGFDVSGTPFLTISPPTITTAGVFSLTFSGTPLDVANGGTGVTTATGTGSVVRANTPILITPIIGNALGTSLKLFGSGNGDVTIVPDATGTSWSFILPTTAGSSNQVLTSSGGGLMTWTTPAPPGTGTVTSVGITVPTFLSVAGTPITTSGILAVTLSGTPLPVLNGGTGVTTSTGSGSNVLSTSPTFTTSININGSTSGTVTVQTQAIAGTYNYNLPTTAGASGQVLTSAGGLTSPMTWTTPTTGTVTSVNMTVPTFLSVTGGPITSTGTFTVTLSGTPLPVLNGGTGVTTSTGSGSNVLSTSPTITTPTFVNPVTNGIGLAGSTSGVVSIFPQALFTSYNFNLPTTAGTAGQVLTSQGGSTSAMTWTNVGTGSVTSVAIAVPAFLSIVSGSPIVSAGTITIGLSGTPLPIANGGTATTTATGTVGSSVVLQNSPTITGTLTTGRIVADSTLTHLLNNTGGSSIMVASYDASVPDLSDRYIQFGMSPTPSGATNLGYSRRSTGQGSYASFGLAGISGGSINVYVSNIPATSTTTGTATINGGLGLTSSIFSGGAITATGAITTSTGGANITGNSTFIGNITETGNIAVNSPNTPSSTGTHQFTTTGNGAGYIAGFLNNGTAAATGIKIGNIGDAFDIVYYPTAIPKYIGFDFNNTSFPFKLYAAGTSSSNTTTGAGVIDGGLGVSGAINAGGPLTVTTNTAGSTTLLTNSFINTNNTTGPFINGQLFPNVPTNSNMYIANGIATTANNCALLGFHPRPSGNYGSLSIYGGPEIQYFSNGNITTPGNITASSFNSGGGNFTYNGGSSAPWTPTLTCTGHTISYTTRVGNYIKIGQQVTACFNIVYDCLAGANNDLLMSLPFSLFSSGASIGYATCILEKSSDLTPGQETADVKTYVFTCDTNIGTNGRFSRHTQGVNAYFQYGGAASFGAIIRGTITYMTSAAA